MAKCDNCNVVNCGECPFFEGFLEEYEPGVGMVEKGRCHKWNEDEIWATKAPCDFAEKHSVAELEMEAFDGLSSSFGEVKESAETTELTEENIRCPECGGILVASHGAGISGSICVNCGYDEYDYD